MTDWIVSNHVTFAPAGTPPPVPLEPVPVIPPECWEVVEGDGQIPALQMVDPNMESRPSPLDETNMTFSDRPIDIFGRVSPNGKSITDLTQNIVWWYWLVDCIGARNAENFPIPKDGYMDTNQEPGDRKLLMATSGSNIRNVKRIFTQSGTKWCEIETFKFNVTPIKFNGSWYYDKAQESILGKLGLFFKNSVLGLTSLTGEPPGRIYTYFSDPHLFNVRTNRKRTNVKTWVTAGGINVSNDVGPKGGKGHEAWPPPAKQRVAQRLLDMWLFPTLPAEMFLHRESLLIDGNVIERKDGILCMMTKYRFHGPDVYGYDSIRGNWYKLSEMLVRGTLENRDGGNGYDWRCYTPSLMPNRRVCPAPNCGWLRP